MMTDSETHTRESPNASDPARTGALARGALIVLAVIAAAAALRVGRVFFIPLATGLFIAVAVWPVQRWLTRRIPRWSASTLIVLVLLVGAVLLTGVVGTMLSMAVSRLIPAAEGVWSWLERARAWLAARGLSTDWLPRRQAITEAPVPRAGVGAEAADAARAMAIPSRAVEHVAEFLTSGLGAALGVLVLIGLSIAVAGFALLEAHRWRERIARVLGESRSRDVTQAFESASRRFRRYLIAKTISGVVAGVATGILCWAVGLPLAWAWGLLSWLMNYIPNVGIFFSGIPPALLAFTTLGVWEGAAVVAGLALIEGLSGNVLAPFLEGSALSLSPLTVLVSLIFWGWLWGAPGAVLAVPLTSALVIAMRHSRHFQTAAALVMEEDSGRRERADQDQQPGLFSPSSPR